MGRLKASLVSSGIAAIAVAVVLNPIALGAQSTRSGRIVSTDKGRVQGSAQEGVESWKGIPFAAPPVGALRWRAPQPANAWTGARDATQVSAACPQEAPRAMGGAGAKPPSEDCLYLNVWRPAGTTGRLPVVVWFHGGGYVFGSGSAFAGEGLARQGLVAVSVNFRLGRLGTFLHPQLVRANADGGRIGNYGYLDMIAALQWVRRNIGAFGGDPRNVTVAGCSSGGAAVGFILASPMTRGLFSKAVAMSGGDWMDMRASLPEPALQAGLEFARTKGIAADDPQALAKLRALPVSELIGGFNPDRMAAQSGPATIVTPYADGRIALDIGNAVASGRYAKVPLIVGADDNDVGGRLGMMTAGSRKLATAISAQGVPVYQYRFAYVPEPMRARAPGAGHCSDNDYFLNSLATAGPRKAGPADIAVGRSAAAYLANFARTGNPNGAGLPAWPRYSRSEDRLMLFAREGQVLAQKDPIAAELDAAGAGRSR